MLFYCASLLPYVCMFARLHKKRSTKRLWANNEKDFSLLQLLPRPSSLLNRNICFLGGTGVVPVKKSVIVHLRPALTFIPKTSLPAWEKSNTSVTGDVITSVFGARGEGVVVAAGGLTIEQWTD